MTKTTDKYSDMDELKNDIAALKKHMSDLTGSLKREGVEDAEKLSEKAKEKLGQLKDRGQQGIHQIEDRVKEKPGQSIAIAFAAGFLASLLLRNRS